VPKQKRTVRNLTVPHYQIDDAIYAEEVQGVRALGQENQAQTVQDMVNARMATHTQLTSIRRSSTSAWARCAASS
jgi:hypothetical protein